MSRQLSHSQLTTFRLCPRKWSYIYQEGLDREKIDPSNKVALFSSKVIHPALGALYMGQVVDWVQVWDAFLEATGRPLLMDEMFTVGNAHKVVEEMSEQVAQDMERYTVVSSERPYYIQLDGEATFISIPDIVMEEKEGGRRVGIDFKFTLSPRKELGKEDISIHHQFVSQALAADLEEVQVQHIRLGKRGKGMGVELVRTSISISPDLRAEMFDELVADAEAIKRYSQLGFYPKNAPTACFSYGQVCGALPLCQAGAFRKGLFRGYQKPILLREEIREEAA